MRIENNTRVKKSVRTELAQKVFLVGSRKKNPDLISLEIPLKRGELSNIECLANFATKSKKKYF